MKKQEIISLPYSARKHIRREKARIRREFYDAKEREERIGQVYEKFARPVKA